MKIRNQPHTLPNSNVENKRCGAKTRSGLPCKSYAANGKGRCRLHGGAIGSGAPIGNSNALKHGLYSKQSKEEFTRIKQLLSESNKTMRKLAVARLS